MRPSSTHTLNDISLTSVTSSIRVWTPKMFKLSITLFIGQPRAYLVWNYKPRILPLPELDYPDS